MESTYINDRGTYFGVGSLGIYINGKRKYPGSSSTFTTLQQQLEDANRKIEEQAALQAERDAEASRVAAEALRSPGPDDKPPGPDGYMSEFYKSTWEILGAEFVIAVRSFFAKGFLPKGVNSTILALIPKKVSAQVMQDYRPISCCNVLYIVISKIIANRLKRVLPKFVSSNQSAFVKDRLLIENVLLATEIVLMAMQFPPMFIQWIMLCVTTASFSIQVNGELAGFFCSSRGLRQGCSLSPYLFVICIDVLSKLLDKAAADHSYGYHPRCRNLRLTHLSFADDLMLLSDGKLRSIEGITAVFEHFAKISGLTISMEKSTLYLAGDVAQRLDTVQFPFEIRKRIGSWTARYLSFVGRFNLISSSSTTLGSWVWTKLLKHRDLAKSFCKVDVGNGEQTSFWFDNWSGLGVLDEVVGGNGVLDLGIAKQSTVAEAWTHRRRQRRHRVYVFNKIEEALHLHWFSTRDTWNHIRTTSSTVSWHRGVWFGHATPKFAFCVWLAALDRISTGVRMVAWNGSAVGVCGFCQLTMETRDHLFFSCPFVSLVWSDLAKGLLKTRFSTDWSTIFAYISNPQLPLGEGFLIRYVFQAVIYAIWRERNGRRHGEKSQSAPTLIAWIDRQVRDQLLSIGLMGDKRYEETFQMWLQTRL
ncbi:PREDICTED: uncharacterized protein LOC104753502 [Camelina sativa]|uniref:Uncharacterized protein LOC104753502 n=1 Tax=Camelina sativa TaxID=90675 RepID=A0ABM0WP89_CAMSA|nr:PREDICTED: uncharacterized protein LOC104753502 [Camelina sativa]